MKHSTLNLECHCHFFPLYCCYSPSLPLLHAAMVPNALSQGVCALCNHLYHIASDFGVLIGFTPMKVKKDFVVLVATFVQPYHCTHSCYNNMFWDTWTTEVLCEQSYLYKDVIHVVIATIRVT